MICDKCLHANVCGCEGSFEEALKYCNDFLGWISVSERLPEKNMACLVSVGKLHLTQIAMYSDLMQTIDHKIFYQGDYGHDSFRDITEYVNAWIPLDAITEPYKAENGEQLETCCAEPVDVADYINNDDYVCALCECPVPINFGIVIDKRKYKKDKSGFYHFHCNKCGLDGRIR